MNKDMKYDGLAPRIKDLFGRNEEINNVYSLIVNNTVTTLYGKSGIGKTSLLQAGVEPLLLRRGFTPIHVRLAEEVRSLRENSLSRSLSEIIILKAEKTSSVTTITDYVNNGASEEFVFILDQFEEVLRSDSEAVCNLLLDIAGVCIGRSDSKVRFLLSLREDYLYLLDKTIDQLSIGVLRDPRFWLHALNRESAIDVLQGEAKKAGLRFENDETLDAILKIVANKNEDEYDPAPLSILIAQLFGKANKSDQIIKVNTKESSEINNIVDSFYLDAISGINRRSVDYLESELITEDGRRRFVTAKELESSMKKKEIDQLECIQIIRKIPDTADYELTHDLLAPSIQRHKQARNERSKPWWEVIFFLPLFICVLVWYLGYHSHPFMTVGDVKDALLVLLGAISLLSAGELIMRGVNRIVGYVSIGVLSVILLLTFIVLPDPWLSGFALLSGVLYLVFQQERWNPSRFKQPDTPFGLSSALCFFMSVTIVLSCIFVVHGKSLYHYKTCDGFDLYPVVPILVLSIILLEVAIDINLSKLFFKRQAKGKDILPILGCVILFFLVWYPASIYYSHIVYGFLWLVWFAYVLMRNNGFTNDSVLKKVSLGLIESLVVILMVLAFCEGVAPWYNAVYNVKRIVLVEFPKDKKRLDTETWIVTKGNDTDKYFVRSVRQDYNIFSSPDVFSEIEFQDYSVIGKKGRGYLLPLAVVDDRPIFDNDVWGTYGYDKASSQLCYMIGRAALGRDFCKAIRPQYKLRDSLLIDLNYTFAKSLNVLPGDYDLDNIVVKLNRINLLCRNESDSLLTGVSDLTDLNHFYELLSLELGNAVMCRYLEMSRYADAAYVLSQMLNMCFGDFLYDEGIVTYSSFLGMSVTNDRSILPFGASREGYYKLFYSLARWHNTKDDQLGSIRDSHLDQVGRNANSCPPSLVSHFTCIAHDLSDLLP